MLVDSYKRKINYLRISLTQNCNFRCLYCMPKIPFQTKLEERLLSFDELFLFVKVAVDNGINKIRITGGEPLLRENLEDFIKMIAEYKPELDLALSTNAFLLKEKAKALKEAGLKRINISLDSLNAQTLIKISQKDILNKVLEGIDEAIKQGFVVKLNTVALKDINEVELINLLDFAKAKNIQIRFIEFMENTHAYGKLKGLSAKEILTLLSSKYHIKTLEKNANTRLYKADEYIFGIIEPHNDEFCDTCNKIRLSAEGLLVPCLYFEEALSLRKALKNKDMNEALNILKQVILNKPEKNKWSFEHKQNSSRAFYQIGG